MELFHGMIRSRKNDFRWLKKKVNEIQMKSEKKNRIKPNWANSKQTILLAAYSKSPIFTVVSISYIVSFYVNRTDIDCDILEM